MWQQTRRGLWRRHRENRRTAAPAEGGLVAGSGQAPNGPAAGKLGQIEPRASLHLVFLMTTLEMVDERAKPTHLNRVAALPLLHIGRAIPGNGQCLVQALPLITSAIPHQHSIAELVLVLRHTLDGYYIARRIMRTLFFRKELAA